LALLYIYVCMYIYIYIYMQPNNFLTWIGKKSAGKAGHVTSDCDQEAV
jgi:hypothetical protein